MNLLSPQRQPDESFEAYKLRRSVVKKMIKDAACSPPYFTKGMYINNLVSSKVNLKDLQTHGLAQSNNP